MTLDRRYAKFGGTGAGSEPLDFSGQVEPMDFTGQVQMADAGSFGDKIKGAARAAASTLTEKLTPERELHPPPVTTPAATLGIRGQAEPLDFTAQVQQG